MSHIQAIYHLYVFADAEGGCLQFELRHPTGTLIDRKTAKGREEVASALKALRSWLDTRTVRYVFGYPCLKHWQVISSWFDKMRITVKCPPQGLACLMAAGSSMALIRDTGCGEFKKEDAATWRNCTLDELAWLAGIRGDMEPIDKIVALRNELDRRNFEICYQTI